MPPKRKRAEDASAEVVPRATRTSTRLKAASNDTAAISNSNAGGADVMDVEPATKKTKRASTKTATGKSGKGGRGQSQQTESSTNEHGNGCSPQVRMWVVFIFSGAALMGIFSFFCCHRNKSHILDDHSKAAAPPDPKPAATKHAGKPEPYSEGRARQLFKTYEDPDTPGEIGPEGFEKLCTDLDISLEGALPLVLAWQMHATEMARFKEAEWLKGTGELRASNLQVLSLVLRNIEDLLLLDKPPIASSVTGSIRKRGSAVPAADPSEPYNRSKYYQYAADTKKAYAELYAFCFALAKPPTARNIDMDTASAFWSVLVAPKYPIMNDILEFINEKGTYKGVNKDLWNMVLEFSRSIQPDLSTYEADGAWPTMLDDFVAWKKAKLNGEDVNVDCDN